MSERVANEYKTTRLCVGHAEAGRCVWGGALCAVNPIMKTQVEFRSSKFPPYHGEEEQINPGLWGKRLAEYFAAKLTEKGIETGELVAEDWGWLVPIPNEEDVPMALCCGHQDGDNDQFLCFTEPAKPVFKKFFTKIDATAPLTRLTEAVDQILTSDSEITDILWTNVE